MVLLLLAGAPLAVGGCSSIHAPGIEAPPPPPPPAPPPPPEGAETPPPLSTGTSGPGLQGAVVGRQFSGPGAYLGPIPTLTLVLKPYAASRSSSVCAAFLKIRTYEAVLAESALTPNAVPLRWPLTGKLVHPDDCTEILAKYDYYAGAYLLGSIQASATAADGKRLDTAGPGPFIVEQYATAKGVGYAVLDFSKATEAGLSFSTIADQLENAVQLQNAALNGVSSPVSAVPAAPTVTKPSKPAKPTSVLGRLCSAVDSQIGKIIRTTIGLIPPAAFVATYVDDYEKAACVTPAAT